MGAVVIKAAIIQAACGDQSDLLATQFDLEFITGMEIEHGCVGLAHQQIAIALNRSHITELATCLAQL